MPRNAAKKTNKSAKRLPVLIKLTNVNSNSKKKKLYKNRSNNNSKNKTKINCTLNKDIKQRKNYKNSKKVVENITFTSLKRIQDKNLTVAITTTASKNRSKTFTQEELGSLQEEEDEEEPLGISTTKTKQFKSIIKLQDLNETALKEQQYLNFENYLDKANVAGVTTEQETNSLLTTTLSETSIKVTEEPAEPLSPTSLRSFSPNSSVSSLYPIVIETFLQQDYRDNKEQQQEKDNSNDTSSKKKKLQHSVNNCCNSSSKNRNNKNSHINNTYNICICCHTAADTLEQHKSQNNNNNNKNNACNNNNNNTTAAIKHSNNSYEQKQSTQQSSAKTTRKVLTLSKQAPSSSSSSSSTTSTSSSSSLSTKQSQEVKARLATLRVRKKVPQSHEPTVDNTVQRTQKISSSVAEAPSESTAEKEIAQSVQRRSYKTTIKEAGKQFIKKKVSPVLDQASLNLIETLNDELKKPNNKRKRNNATAVLLGLATLYQPRSKRITSTSLSLFDKPLNSSAAAQDKNDQKLKTGNFIKPAQVEAANTNTKKRARIMSLYERPFQAASDGRGGVVGNGYMTSSRSSASSGGAPAALVMNDNCDNQDMANQYYLSGTSSGPGSASNSNPSLLANGSTINHAPTMGTLCNIGNTCYLNSVVYTLRFAPKFLHNLHHLLADLAALQQNIARARAKSSSLGRGISAVHMENARSWSNKDLASMEQYNSGTAINPSSSAINSTALTQVTQKTSHQVLTEKLHELYQSLHRNEINESMEPHHADTLLHAIQDVSSIFEGNQQQDAHEFLMCLLNSVRETSQTLIKAIAECPDVILNGYISNPDEIERELIKSHAAGNSGHGSNSSNSNSLASASSKTSSFFSRKSKRKDENKNSKNSRLQSPLKDALVTGTNPQTTTTANSLFYLNTNDLNLMATTPTPAAALAAGTANNSCSLASPSNSSSSQLAGAGDETDTPTSVALILKDKQRLEGKIKELGLDFFNEDFEGITVSTTKCLSCETITEQKETMIDIAVPVPQAGYESKELMDRPSSFIQNSCITREYFRNGNKYRCEQCCGYTEAIRSISYEVLPRLLIIQLSRFSGGMEKINSYIPTSFTLQCFCSKCCELSDANKLHIYKLYSVITHVGATMSVGHYIAYTCSLEWANEYINCPKEQRRRASQERNLGTASNGSGANAAGGSSQTSTAAASSGLSTSSTGFMKMKMKFGRSKASSSGDMSKNVKQLNGLNASSKTITNGIGKLTMNNAAGSGSATPQCPTTCQSINCCAMRLTLQQQLQYQSANNSSGDFSEESSQYSNGAGFSNQANYNNNVHHNFSTTANNHQSSGYGSTGRGATKVSYGTLQNSCTEPIWYMCDDDKIKAMTQREFEELLSPARKITITPYLLFYARYNLQSTPPKSATASTCSPGPVTSSPQTSWSNESLQSSGHSAHSSGMRM